MYNKVFPYFTAAVNKLYFNAVTPQLQYKFINVPFMFFTQNCVCSTRGYCNNPSIQVNQEYKNMYKEQLKERLKDKTYEALFEKYKAEVEEILAIGGPAPIKLKPQHWLNLLECTTKRQRSAYLQFLWKTEKKEESALRKKELKKKQKSQELSENQEENKYNLYINTLFHRIREPTIKNFYNSRLISAMLHSSPIVFDLEYEKHMTMSERSMCAKQLLIAFSENRLHNDPCNLYFCNTSKNSLIMQKLHKTIPSLYNDDFPLNITSKSYLEIFDRSKLIYLTPHCRTPMNHYDHDAVYIIGAMVDKITQEPLSFEKAKREGLRMVKLPLSEKLDWGSGSSQTLPLNQVLTILLDLRYTNDWNIALQHIPIRKLKPAREKQMMTKIMKREALISYLKRNM